jgi:predicted membrane protein
MLLHILLIKYIYIYIATYWIITNRIRTSSLKKLLNRTQIERTKLELKSNQLPYELWITNFFYSPYAGFVTLEHLTPLPWECRVVSGHKSHALA